MGKFQYNRPTKAPEGMTEAEFIEQQFGYPPYAHQEESNAAETGRADPPPEPEE